MSKSLVPEPMSQHAITAWQRCAILYCTPAASQLLNDHKALEDIHTKTSRKEETMAYFSTTQVERSGISTRLQAILISIADYMKSHRIYLATIVEMSSLSNRDLADMGINRSMIKGLAYSAAGLD